MKEIEEKNKRKKHYVAGVSTSCSALVGIPGLTSMGAVRVGVEVRVGVATGGLCEGTDVGLRLVAEVGVGVVVAVVVIVEVVAKTCVAAM